MSEREAVSTAAVLEYARDVRAVIARGWCQGAFARDEYWCEIQISHPRAVRWCLAGAMHVVAPRPVGLLAALVKELASVVFNFPEGAVPNIGEGSLTDWNDIPGRKVEHVLAALDRVIETLEAAA